MAIYGPEEFITRTGKKVTLRHCEERDVDAFLVFQPKVAQETTHTLQAVGRVPERTKIEAAWSTSIQDPRELRIGAFVEDRLIAQLSFHPESKPLHPWTQHTGRLRTSSLPGKDSGVVRDHT